MDEVLINGFWTLLGAGIVVMAYYYGYCRGDRKRFEVMKKDIKHVIEDHWELIEKAFRDGYKAGRAKKMGVDRAYEAWPMTPLRKDVKDILEDSVNTAPAAEPLAKEPAQRCDDCVHHEYDVEDTDPKTYVMVCKKGLCPTKTVCEGFEKKIIWEHKLHPEDLRERMTSTYGSTQDGNKIRALTRKDLYEATSMQTAESECSKCIHWCWILKKIGGSPEHGCALEDKGGIDLHGKCSKFEEKE